MVSAQIMQPLNRSLFQSFIRSRKAVGLHKCLKKFKISGSPNKADPVLVHEHLPIPLADFAFYSANNIVNIRSVNSYCTRRSSSASDTRKTKISPRIILSKHRALDVFIKQCANAVKEFRGFCPCGLSQIAPINKESQITTCRNGHCFRSLCKSLH